MRLGEIYYAAPDVDFPAFVRNLPDYVGQVRRVTVAVNLADSVLAIAQRHQRVSRAGLPDFAEIDPEEARWLGAATQRTELDVLSMRPEDLPGLPPRSHQFWYDHPWVSTDILLKFRWHMPPVARGLLGKRVGEEAVLTTPKGKREVTITSVQWLAVGAPDDDLPE